VQPNGEDRQEESRPPHQRDELGNCSEWVSDLQDRVGRKTRWEPI